MNEFSAFTSPDSALQRATDLSGAAPPLPGAFTRFQNMTRVVPFAALLLGLGLIAALPLHSWLALLPGAGLTLMCLATFAVNAAPLNQWAAESLYVIEFRPEVNTPACTVPLTPEAAQTLQDLLRGAPGSFVTVPASVSLNPLTSSEPQTFRVSQVQRLTPNSAGFVALVQ